MPAGRIALHAAVIIAAATAGAAVRFGVYSANHADASGYIAEGELWSRGELVRPVPLQLWARWPNAAASGSPLGFRPGPTSGTEVPYYPPGFPVLLATARRLGGEWAPYTVAPLMAGVLVLTTFLLGNRLAGSLAGLAAAVLVAISPVTFLHTVHPMSDVPAAACWAAAWYLALLGSRSASIAGGLLAAMATLIRPNLAPLAVVPLALILFGAAPGSPRTWRWSAAWCFAAAAALGPALTAWTQWALYGHPFQPGYPGWEAFFRLEHVGANLRNYPRLWGEVYGWLPLAGLAVPVIAWRRPALLASGARPVVWSALAFAVLNLALYLPYLPFEHWAFLRFLLPATVAGFVLFGAALASGIRWAWTAGRTAWAVAFGLVALLALAAVGGRRTDLLHYALEDWRSQSRIPMMGKYLREAMPPNAVALSFIHSGAIAHYTGRNVVRLEIIEPSSLDRIVSDLERRGLVPVLVIDDTIEQPFFAGRFPGSRFSALDWPPRAEFTAVTTIRYFVLADRARHQRGEHWPTDRLR